MALSPEMKDMVISASQRAAFENKVRHLDNEVIETYPDIRAELAWLGFQKATKRELRQVIMNILEADSLA
jgi:hypothetical protein